MVSTRLQSGCSSNPGSVSPSQQQTILENNILHQNNVYHTSSSSSQSTSVIVSTHTYAPSGGVHISDGGGSSSKQPLHSINGTTTPSTSTPPPPYNFTSTMNLMNFPNELLIKIISYCDYKKVSNLRLVNKRMDNVCGQVLSSTFMKLQSTMLHRFQNIKSKMPRRESARRQHPLACESDIIEMLHMRLTLLQMSFGKHIERKHCCFFAGEILDEVYRIIHHIKTTPRLARPYKVTDELFDLSTMAMEYFKDKIEPTLPEITYFGTDFIDLPSSFPSSKNDSNPSDSICGFDSSLELSPRSPPQSNMVLRKRIRKIKQGMKKYSSQLTLMKRELKLCRSKLIDQQKTVVEYATRLDDYDKKNEETSRKFSNVLQELNKCKTELQFFRSKFPFNPDCTCGGSGNSSSNGNQPLLANEPPSSIAVIQDFLQVLSPQAVYIPPGGSSINNELSVESANIAVEVAAEPLNGSASPRGDHHEEEHQQQPPCPKKLARNRSSAATIGSTTTTATAAVTTNGSNHVDGHSSDTEPGRKMTSRTARAVAALASSNVSGNDDSSGGSDHETLPSINIRKTTVRSAAAAAASTTTSDLCVPSTSVTDTSSSSSIITESTATTSSLRNKKRKSALNNTTPVIETTKVLRGNSSLLSTSAATVSVTTTNTTNGLHACNKRRRH